MLLLHQRTLRPPWPHDGAVGLQVDHSVGATVVTALPTALPNHPLVGQAPALLTFIAGKAEAKAQEEVVANATWGNSPVAAWHERAARERVRVWTWFEKSSVSLDGETVQHPPHFNESQCDDRNLLKAAL